MKHLKLIAPIVQVVAFLSACFFAVRLIIPVKTVYAAPLPTFEYKPAPIFNNAPNRALNTPFQPQASRATHGTYSITITTAVSLLNLNSAGSAFLEISPDGTTWTTIQSAGKSQTLAVSLSVGLTDATTYNLTGWVPLNWYCRIRTTLSGGATAVLANGQEVAF